MGHRHVSHQLRQHRQRLLRQRPGADDARHLAAVVGRAQRRPVLHAPRRRLQLPGHGAEPGPVSQHARDPQAAAGHGLRPGRAAEPQQLHQRRAGAVRADLRRHGQHPRPQLPALRPRVRPDHGARFAAVGIRLRLRRADRRAATVLQRLHGPAELVSHRRASALRPQAGDPHADAAVRGLLPGADAVTGGSDRARRLGGRRPVLEHRPQRPQHPWQQPDRLHGRPELVPESLHPLEIQLHPRLPRG